MFRQPVLIVARGLEHRIAEGRIQGTRLLALKAVYRGAATVVYNELYMRDLLTNMGVKRLEFLPNSIELPEVIDRSGREGCNFLFMNSLKSFRHPETVVMALNSLCDDGHGSGLRLRVVGLRQELGYSGNLEREQELKALAARHPDRIELLPWSDDNQEHLAWGDVFLLPADVVFLNYALLESMGTGMPAIVQESNGSSLIVEHGLTGAIVPNHAAAWAAAMLALARDPSERQRQGAAARAKVAAQFSADAAANRWLQLYWSCGANRQPEPKASTAVHEHASAGDRLGGSAF
jgi:glycosyltransferase involved in cell wall biosynthesis